MREGDFPKGVKGLFLYTVKGDRKKTALGIVFMVVVTSSILCSIYGTCYRLMWKIGSQ
jgi:hypothetical protein